MEALRTKRLSQAARHHTGERKAQPHVERFGTGRVPRNASITLGRFHPVNLQPKLGIAVYGKLQILKDDGDEVNLHKIYDDLWPCYVRYHQLYHGCMPVHNYIDRSGLHDAFAMMLAFLSNMMGNQAEIDILSIGYGPAEKYYFCAYQQQFSKETWHVIQLMPVIKKLMRWYKSDLNIFLLFLNAFSRVGIDSWFSGQMKWILDESMDEEIQFSDHDKETIAELEKIVLHYNEGMPAQVESWIRNSYTHIAEDGSVVVDIDHLELQNETFTKNLYIRNIIKAGIGVLRFNKSIYDYNYIPAEYEDNMGLRYPGQFTIVWDIEDTLTSYYEDFMNVEANEGLFYPYQFLDITPECNELFMPDQFTRTLSNFFDYAVDQLNLFMKPKTKTNEHTE